MTSRISRIVYGVAATVILGFGVVATLHFVASPERGSLIKGLFPKVVIQSGGREVEVPVDERDFKPCPIGTGCTYERRVTCHQLTSVPVRGRSGGIVVISGVPSSTARVTYLGYGRVLIERRLRRVQDGWRLPVATGEAALLVTSSLGMDYYPFCFG